MHTIDTGCEVITKIQFFMMLTASFYDESIQNTNSFTQKLMLPSWQNEKIGSLTKGIPTLSVC